MVPWRLVGGGSLEPEDSDTGSGQDIIGAAPVKSWIPIFLLRSRTDQIMSI